MSLYSPVNDVRRLRLELDIATSEHEKERDPRVRAALERTIAEVRQVLAATDLARRMIRPPP